MSNPVTSFSSTEQMTMIKQMVVNYLRLPFALDTVPGSLLEAVLANVHDAEVLKTYDFADVVKRGAMGWQVKCTKSSTPVTWMRAKIPQKQSLIETSRSQPERCQELGDTIINYCNVHASASLNLYQLSQINYARLVLFPEGRILYFERSLITEDKPRLFNPEDYVWHWSTPKQTKGKEQLPAFVGTHRETDIKYFAWHGLGENQLHFSGEKLW